MPFTPARARRGKQQSRGRRSGGAQQASEQSVSKLEIARGHAS
jgi:hypothetical protein